MTNEDMRKEANPEAADKELKDVDLNDVSGGALYWNDGRMITTDFNSCSQWKCGYCKTYSGKSDCPIHPREGMRWCHDCFYCQHVGILGLACNYHKK